MPSRCPLQLQQKGEANSESEHQSHQWTDIRPPWAEFLWEEHSAEANPRPPSPTEGKGASLRKQAQHCTMSNSWFVLLFLTVFPLVNKIPPYLLLGPGAGYMPQELALMPTMTVADHFQYYGQLAEMSPREICKRSVYLVNLLQIPSAERPVEKLSGGQQRRTSLALTLLHSPPLLILDEPTVCFLWGETVFWFII